MDEIIKRNDINRKFHNVFDKTEDTKNRSILANIIFLINILQSIL